MKCWFATTVKSLDITIAGNSIDLTDKNSWSEGPILIEVWRDGANNLHAWVASRNEHLFESSLVAAILATALLLFQLIVWN